MAQIEKFSKPDCQRIILKKDNKKWKKNTKSTN